MANNAKVKAAGISPVEQTYADTWTSQLFVLADYHNVPTADPSSAEQYTANKEKKMTPPTPRAAIRGFKQLGDGHKAGYLNKAVASAKFEDGLRGGATGKAAHCPMLT